MSAHKSMMTIEKRILLHLLDYRNYKVKTDMPMALTKNGIAPAVGANYGYVSFHINELVAKGFVRECFGRVKRGVKKQNYFLLTEAGDEYTKKLKIELSDLQITLKQPDGTSKMMPLKDIIPYLDGEGMCPGVTVLDIYNNISKDYTLGIEHLKEIMEKQFLDFSAEAPKIMHFFGRKREIELLEKCVEDKERYKIILIYGMPGIGKTTLAVKLIERYRGSKCLFWHNFHKLDTLGSVLFILAKFLSKLGDDHLEIYLRTHKSSDYYEVSTILGKSLGKIDAVLIFDDFHKSDDEIKEFFYNRFPPSIRRKHHLIAARWYENRDVPSDLIEAIYHYQQAGEFERASRFAIDSSASILDGGCVAEFLATLEIFDKKNLESGVWAEILILKGKACNTCGEWKKALLFFNQVGDIVTIIGDKKLEVKAICESGHILEEQNQFDRAMEYFRKCMRTSREADYSMGTAMGYRGIGRVHWRRSEHEEAIVNYKKCLEISERLGDLELMASTYTDLGNIHDERYETEMAIDYYNKSLDILKKVKNTYETARAYGNLGITYRHLEEFDKAIECTAKELTLAQDLRETKLIGYSTAGLSYCFAKIGDFEKAKEYAKNAEELALKIRSENIMFDVYHVHGLLCKHEKRWDDAVGFFKRNIEFLEDLNAPYQLSDLHFELGLLYKEMDDTKNAKEHLNIALTLYTRLGLEKAELVREKLSKY